MRTGIYRTFLVFLFMAGAFFLVNTSMTVAEEPAYYTQMNIWYEDPEDILSTNYHRGAILPAGTEVEILQQGKKKISFRRKDTGKKFRIVLVKKYTDLDRDEFFNRYFAKANPLESAEYKAFSKEEKENIKEGEIEEGMSKAAVLMAYGYPPTHRTPSTDDSQWTFWVHRFGTVGLEFEGDTLTHIKQ